MKTLPSVKWVNAKRKSPTVGGTYYCKVRSPYAGDRPEHMIVEWEYYPNGNWAWAIEDCVEAHPDSEVIAWLEELPQDQTEG